MKRHSIISIITKCQNLTIRACKPEYVNQGGRYITKATFAAVNEIIRLNAEADPLPKVDMKAESEKFLDAVKTICEDYNKQINL